MFHVTGHAFTGIPQTAQELLSVLRQTGLEPNMGDVRAWFNSHVVRNHNTFNFNHGMEGMPTDWEFTQDE